MNDVNEQSVQLRPLTRHFRVLLSPTPCGARLARLLSTERLHAWDLPHHVVEAAAHVIAELASNAATHGRLPGRDFLLTLQATADVLRIEVTDTRGAESGRGLLLVEALADRWGVEQGPVAETVLLLLMVAKPPRRSVGDGEFGA